MPVTPSYPGVYIEEIRPGPKPIEGVPTSTTVFIGRALRGPTDGPRLVRSLADFERLYGGLWLDAPLTFAVQQFFMNGGIDAVICRVHHGAAAATLDVPVGNESFSLVAASEGAWGSRLRVRFDDADPAPDGSEAPDSRFSLTVKDFGTGSIEAFPGLSTDPGHPRHVTNVLRDESSLIRVARDGTVPAAGPPANEAAPPGQNPLEVDRASIAFGQDGSDGDPLVDADVSDPGLKASRRGLWLLDQVDLINVVCIPPLGPDLEVGRSTWDAAIAYATRRLAMVIVDPPATWTDVPGAIAGLAGVATSSPNAAIYFPRIVLGNSLRGDRLETFAPCGAVAGVWARTDVDRGLWKAPAGLEATISGAAGLSVGLTDATGAELNELGVNCLRTFPGDRRVVWGARTLAGADQAASEWKYIPVRRLALFMEASLARGTEWVLFEPNGEPLWAKVRQQVGAFLEARYRDGAFAGRTSREAWFVKCDRETTSQDDIDRGFLNIVAGFAPSRAGEFVIIRIQQKAGEVAEAPAAPPAASRGGGPRGHR